MNGYNMPGLEAVQEITETIIAGSQPEAVILFGSIAATGTGNDIDLLIISGKDEKTIRESLRPFYENIP